MRIEKLQVAGYRLQVAGGLLLDVCCIKIMSQIFTKKSEQEKKRKLRREMTTLCAFESLSQSFVLLLLLILTKPFL